jgi:hypothetical protein
VHQGGRRLPRQGHARLEIAVPVREVRAELRFCGLEEAQARVRELGGVMWTLQAVSA